MSTEPRLPSTQAKDIFLRASSLTTRIVIIAPSGSGKTTLCAAAPKIFSDLDALPEVAAFYRYLSETYSDKWFENDAAKDEKNAFFAQFSAEGIPSHSIVLTAERHIVLNPNFLTIAVWLPSPDLLSRNLDKRALLLANTDNPQRFVDSSYVLKGLDKYKHLAREFSLQTISIESDPFKCELPSLVDFVFKFATNSRFHQNLLIKRAPFLIVYASTIAKYAPFLRSPDDVSKEQLIADLTNQPYNDLFNFNSLLLWMLLSIKLL